MNFKLKNDTFLRALLRQPTDYTPLWMMRQAGRYLPEYRASRQRAGSFLGLCKSPDFATEVTLQPLDRFPLDAAILFSDILTVPDARGGGGGSDDYARVKTLMYNEPKLMHHILDVTAQAVVAYLNAQIEAGAQAVMIFDSWGGVLSHAAFHEFSLAYTRRILAGLLKR